MNSSSSYVAIRDDTGLKSLSNNEQEFLKHGALASQSSLRDDGRQANDVRKVKLNLGRWDNGSECTVQWGSGTRITCTCSASLVPPMSDRPSEGMVQFSVDLSPMASPSFRLAPPVTTAVGGGGGGGGSSSNSGNVKKGQNFSDQNQRLLSNRIIRCIERIIIIGGALDTEALCLVPDVWVWKLSVNLTVLDHGGNLLDACVLAAMAALRHYRKPQVDLNESEDGKISLPTMIPSIIKEATPLPLHHTPLSISFALIAWEDAATGIQYSSSSSSMHASSTSLVATLIDPTDREELVQSGSLTVAMNVHSEVCLLDYGGGCELTPQKLKQCWKIANPAIQNLCHFLEDTLSAADTKAQQERLETLQQQQQQQQSNNNLVLNPKLPMDEGDGPYFQQQTDTVEIDNAIEIDQIQQAQNEAEEAYRQQALDYAVGHVATAVREDKDTAAVSFADSKNNSNKSKNPGNTSLLAAMLKSAKLEEESTQTAKPMDVDKHDNQKINIESNNIITKEQKTNQVVSDPVSTYDMESDKEEKATMLQKEKIIVDDSSPTTDTEKKTINPQTVEPMDEDIDDLAMAVKKKNKKSKSKKKK